MSLHLRRRGNLWHARGTIRVDRQVIHVPEFSTGCDKRIDAEIVLEKRAAEIRSGVLDGSAGRARRLTIADFLLSYLTRPGGTKPYDQQRITDLSERIGHLPVGEAVAAWGLWLRTRGADMAPGTAARWRAILQAALAYGARQENLEPVKLPRVSEPTREGVRYLTQSEQDALLAAYNKWARPVATLLCFGGLRSQEALQLDWRHVDWKRKIVFVAQSKTGRPRTVPMHPRVQAEIEKIWKAAGKPTAGPVFIGRWGAYRDTRQTGGNPLAKAHATACKAAKITHFRVHDWRHHFASWMVMSGTDLHTLMRIGGWRDPRMVQRYAAVSNEHLEQAIARLA